METRSAPDVKLFHPVVIVAALGYFVDIYDLVLFSIVRVPSLKGIGLIGDDLFHKGILLLDIQMIGMLIGGVFWGILGDKKGRLSVLFGSIILYSVANLLNAAVEGIASYAVLRFIAGVGLAGELGAGITLVSEILPKRLRGWGTLIVATVGVTGAILAGAIGELFHWRVSFVVGGSLGLLLLFLRISVVESGMFGKLKAASEVSRGDFTQLFRSGERFRRYVKCILVGVPTWFVIGILVTFGPEFAPALGITEPVTGAKSILFCYSGLVFGDFGSGYLSQVLKSRRRAVMVFLAFTFLGMLLYYDLPEATAAWFYAACFVIGFGAGFWAVFVTLTAEQFGTNLRATVTTSAPNFVRGSVVPLTLGFQASKDAFGILAGGWIVGGTALALAFLSAWRLPETFHKDLDYLEELS